MEETYRLYHGMSTHELTQIFYNDLGSQDRYLLDVTSGDNFMRGWQRIATTM